MSLTMANNSVNCPNTSNSKWNDADIDIARASVSLASAILCVAAVVLLVYSKLYSSFNYRLILYLLIASIINCVVDTLQVPFSLYGRDEVSLTPKQTSFCHALGYLEVYCSWNMLLTTSFFIVEIFTIVTCEYQLIKLEIPCTTACFGLPCLISVVPIFTESYGLVEYYCGLKQYKDDDCNDPDPIIKYIWVIPGFVVAGINLILILVAVLSLAYKLHKIKSLNTPEREELIAKHDQECYSKALKEILPLVVYPVTVLVLLIIESLNPINSDSTATHVFNCISDVLSGCMGGISAGTFFIHFLVRLQRPAKQPPMEQGGLAQSINTRTSATGHGSTYYTAEDYLEGSK